MGHAAQIIAAEAGEQRRLLDGGMAVLGGVDDERPIDRLEPAAGEAEIRSRLAGTEQGHQSAGRGRVLDDAVPARVEPECLPHPVERHVLDFRQGGTGCPGQSDLPETGAEKVAEHARQFGIGREVAEEAGTLPVRKARHNARLDQPDHVIEG